MRQLILISLIIWTNIVSGQTLGHGIYRGQSTPFRICYLTYNDSTIEVEYFSKKSSQIFGHFPAKKLILNMESFSTKPIFKSSDGSVLVFLKKKCYKVKRKGFTTIKVYKTTETQADISILRNRNKLFRFYQDTFKDLCQSSAFTERQIWDKLTSYELEKYLQLDNITFNNKIAKIKDDIKKNWR